MVDTVDTSCCHASVKGKEVSKRSLLNMGLAACKAVSGHTPEAGAPRDRMPAGGARHARQRAQGGGAAGQGVAAAASACQDGGFGAGDEPVGGLPAGADFAAGTAAHFAEPINAVRAIESGRRSITWPAQLCAPAPPTAHRRRPSSQRSSQRSGSSPRPRQHQTRPRQLKVPKQPRPRQQQPRPRQLRVPRQPRPRQHQTRPRQLRVPQQPRPRQHKMCARQLKVPQRTLTGTSCNCNSLRTANQAAGG